MPVRATVVAVEVSIYQVFGNLAANGLQRCLDSRAVLLKLVVDQQGAFLSDKCGDVSARAGKHVDAIGQLGRFNGSVSLGDCRRVAGQQTAKK